MKGFAIILIMLCHCSGYWAVYYTPLGGIGVAIFLLLSGYGLNESYKRSGLKGFWVKRIGRMMLPYAITIGIFTVACGHSLWWFLKNIFCIDTYYWFIAFIMYWYIAFYLLTKIPILCRYRLCLLMMLSVLCFFFVNYEQAFSFTAGVLISQYKQGLIDFDSKRSREVTVFGATLICLAIVALAVKQIPSIREASNPLIMHPLEFLLKFCGGTGSIIVLRNVRLVLESKFLFFTGVISYELYLVHYPFYSIIGTSLWAMVGLVVASYAVACIFQKLDSKIFSFATGKMQSQEIR